MFGYRFTDNYDENPFQGRDEDILLLDTKKYFSCTKSYSSLSIIRLV